MFAQIAYPEKLLPEELDKYLAAGWFRMRQTIFTTHFLHFNQQFYAAIWLRVALNSAIYDKKFQSLVKLNKHFSTEIKKTGINGISTAHELLYLHYRQSVSFDISPSLKEMLLGIDTHNKFNTYEVNVFDGDTLVAAGFFDLGEKSAAGITCIYHPSYKKYSLGKYLMYLKLDFCKQQQLQYFYPGYMVPGYSAFDYKLEIGKASLEYLQLSTMRWLPCLQSSPIKNPLQDMVIKLSEIKPYLVVGKIPHAFLYYRFFEANLDPYYYGHQLFDFPVFLYCYLHTDATYLFVIVFDVRDETYRLLQCRSLINIGDQQDCITIFNSDLLKVEKLLFVSKTPAAISTLLSGLLESR
jgi:leucyl-tRNA---protein transferase